MGKMFRMFLTQAVSLGFMILIGFIPLTYKAGVDGTVTTYLIPLYAKLGGFLYRDYQYRRLAREITEEIKDKNSKVLAIYKWTVENIRKDKPDNWPVRDDHILNIIIKGYGESDQMADVFTTLCAYSGMRAFYEVYRKEESGKVSASIVLSFVKIDNRWLVFDIYNRKYFVNSQHKIASIDDLINNPELVKKGAGELRIKGVLYADFFELVKPINKKGYLRPERQMFGKRILFEASKILK